MPKRFNDFNTYLRAIYGKKVHKISLDAGFTCPNRDGTLSFSGCIFCNPKGSGTDKWRAGLSVSEQIKEAKEAIRTRYKAEKFLAYFQSFSNTYAPIETLAKLYQEALSVPDVVGLCIGTRPDCIYPEVLDLLEIYAKNYLIWIEYGLQSINEKTLQRINRGHGLKEFFQAVEQTKQREKINICLHLILGLPGENRSDMINTAREVSSLGIEGIKLHLLYVVKGTRLAEMYTAGEYQCLQREEYIDILCEFLQFLSPSILIQRLISDPHPNELLAPLWALEKSQNRLLIEKAIEEKNIWQGQKITGLP